MNLDSTLISSLIASLVSLAGVIIAYISTNNQLKMKIKELELREIEIKATQANLYEVSNNLKKEMVASQQTQLREVLIKRLEAYPLLWQVILKYWQHWNYHNKELNQEWCEIFINELFDINEKHGILFSQDVYYKYQMLRAELIKANKEFKNKGHISQETRENIDDIWFGTSKDDLGLSTCLKNDLGSYRVSAIQKAI